MSRRFTWGILAVLVGLLYASWWAVFQNQYQGAKAYVLNEKQTNEQQMKEALDKRNAQDKQARKAVQDRIKKGPAATAAAPTRDRRDEDGALAPKPVKASKPAVSNEPYIAPDWYLKRKPGELGVKEGQEQSAKAAAEQARLAAAAQAKAAKGAN